MRNLITVVTCLLALCCLALPNSMPVAQDKAVTLETPSKTGKRLTTTVTREYTETTEAVVAGEVSTTTTASWWIDAMIHEWHMAVGDDGRPQRVMRTYEKLKREAESKLTIAIGDIKLDTPRAEKSDPLTGQILVYDVAIDGTRKLHGDALSLAWEHDRVRAVAPFETSLLPGKAVKVGESWTVPGKTFELLYEREIDLLSPKDDPQPWESGDITVTLRASDGMVAALDFSGELTFRLRKKAAYGDEEVTNWVTTAKVNGELLYELGVGPQTRRMAVDFTRSGKKDGIESTGTAKLDDHRVYRNGWLFEATRDAGTDGVKDKITEARGFAGGKIAAGNIVVGLNFADGARILEFDPVSAKYVRLLCVLPAPKTVDHLSLSADRARLAFASTLNDEISVAPWNTFVLELETGKINQVTPSWATGEGIAPELKTARTGTITGSVSFYDEYERATRSDGISATAHVDQTRCHVVANGGAFRIDNVPEGALLLRISGTVPRPRFGVPEGVSVGSRNASVVTLVNVKGGETTNLGALSLQIGGAELIYASPTWRGDTLCGNLFGAGMMWEAGYPKRSFKLDTEATLPAAPDGFACSPDGKQLAISVRGGHRLLLLDAISRKQLKKIELAPASVPYASRISWHKDALLTGGFVAVRHSFLSDCPALLRVTDKADVLKTWPEWSGRTIIDAGIHPDGKTFLLVVEGPLPLEKETRIEVYHWNPATDTTTRLTSSGCAGTISNVGR